MEDLFEGLNSRKKRKSTAHILKEEKTKNVYGVLIRVSTDMQVEDGDSIPMQQDRANEIIENNDGILYKFYIEEGISASKNRIKDRPQLQELLADVEAGIVNKIIAYKRDRLARNTKDYLTILEVCAKAKCDIIFSASGETQMMNDGVTGKVLETFLASIAEMESYNTSVRVRDVMSNKASKGEFTGFTLPYGYCKDEENKIIIEEGTESVIQEIEDLYLGGIGLLSIAKWLNGQKIMNLGVRPDGAVLKKALHKNRVDHWTKAAIESILFNPYYAGIIEYSMEGNKSYQIDDEKFIRAKGQHPAFRTLERQKEIYRARDRRTLQAPRLYNTTFLLTGLLYCGECSHKYMSRNTTKNGKRYSYYVCGSKHNDSKTVNQNPCKNKLYKKEILEEFIESSIEKYLSNVTFTGLEQDIVNEFSKKQDDISVKLKELEDTLNSLNTDEQKILRLLMDLDPEKSTYNIFKERYENELTVIFEKTNDAKKLKLELTNQMEDKQDDEFITKKVLEKMQNFNKVYRNSPVHLRKASLDEIIDRIELFADGTVELYFKIQLDGTESDSNSGSSNTNNGQGTNTDTSSNPGIKVMNADTDEEVIINDLMGDVIKPKIITNISFKITVPSSIILNIEEWRKEVSTTLKTKFPQWIKQIAGGEHITAYRVYKQTGMDKGTVYRIFGAHDVPVERRVEYFAKFYGSSVDDFIEFTGLNMSRNIIFDKFFQWSKLVSRNDQKSS